MWAYVHIICKVPERVSFEEIFGNDFQFKVIAENYHDGEIHTCTILSTCDVPNVPRMAYLDSTRIGTSLPTDILDIPTVSIAKLDSETKITNKPVTSVVTTLSSDVLEMPSTSKTVRSTLLKSPVGRTTVKRKFSWGTIKSTLVKTSRSGQPLVLQKISNLPRKLNWAVTHSATNVA